MQRLIFLFILILFCFPARSKKELPQIKAYYITSKQTAPFCEFSFFDSLTNSSRSFPMYLDFTNKHSLMLYGLSECDENDNCEVLGPAQSISALVSEEVSPIQLDLWSSFENKSTFELKSMEFFWTGKSSPSQSEFWDSNVLSLSPQSQAIKSFSFGKDSSGFYSMTLSSTFGWSSLNEKAAIVLQVLFGDTGVYNIPSSSFISFENPAHDLGAWGFPLKEVKIGSEVYPLDSQNNILLLSNSDSSLYVPDNKFFYACNRQFAGTLFEQIFMQLYGEISITIGEEDGPSFVYSIPLKNVISSGQNIDPVGGICANIFNTSKSDTFHNTKYFVIGASLLNSGFVQLRVSDDQSTSTIGYYPLTSLFNASITSNLVAVVVILGTLLAAVLGNFAVFFKKQEMPCLKGNESLEMQRSERLNLQNSLEV